ncbi:MAG: flagellar biosynthesis anti-sigma factor FlgM [Mariprofundaceae bacterium]
MVRIEGSNRPASVQKSGGSKGSAKSSASGGKRSGGERVEVSDASALRERAQVMLGEMPEVRMERIEEIRDALESGRFKISSEKVAAQIVNNALAEHSWK